MALLHMIGHPFKSNAFQAIYNQKYTRALLNMLVLQYIGDEIQCYNSATLVRSGYIKDIPVDSRERLNFVLLKKAVDYG